MFYFRAFHIQNNSIPIIQGLVDNESKLDAIRVAYGKYFKCGSWHVGIFYVKHDLFLKDFKYFGDYDEPPKLVKFIEPFDEHFDNKDTHKHRSRK